MTGFGDKASGKSASGMAILAGAVAGVATAITTQLLNAVGQGIGALVGLGKESIGLAMSFQDMTVGLEMAGKAAAEAAGIPMSQLGEIALSVGDDTRLLGVSAVGAADAMTGLLKNGLSLGVVMGDVNAYMNEGAELGGVLRAAIDLAAATELDMVQASDLATIALNTFGGALETDAEKAEFANLAMDNFVRTADASQASVTDLAAAMENVGPVANMYGFTLNDVNVALALMSQRGMKGSEAGTALKSMMTNLTSANKKTVKALDEWGISLYDSEDQMYSLIEIMGQFDIATSTMTDAQRNQFVQTVAGTYGMKGLATIIDSGIEGWYDMAEAIENATGMTELAAERQKTFSARMEALQGNVETLKIRIGTALLPVLTDMVGIFSEIVDRYGPFLIGAFEGVGEAVGKFTGYISAAFKEGDNLSGMLGSLPTYMQPLAKRLGEIAQGFTTGQKVIDNWIQLIKSGIDPLKALKYSVTGFFGEETWGRIEPIATAVYNLVNTLRGLAGTLSGSAPLLDRVTDLVHGLAMAFTGNQEKADSLAGTFKRLVETVGPIIKTVVNWVRENLKLKDILLTLGIAALPMVKAAILGVAGVIGTILVPVGLAIAKVALLRKAWESNFLGIQDRVRAVWGWLTTYIPKALQVASATVKRLLETMRGLWDKHGGKVIAVVEWIANNLGAILIPAIGGLVGMFGGGVFTYIAMLFGDVNLAVIGLSGAAGVLAGVLMRVKVVWEIIGIAMRNAITVIGDMLKKFTGIGTGFAPTIERLRVAFDGLKVALKKLWVAIQPVLAVIGGVLVGAFGIASSAIAGLIVMVVALAEDMANALGPAIQVFTGIVEVITGVVNTIVGLFELLITGSTDKLGTGLGEIAAGIENIFGGLRERLDQVLSGGWLTGAIQAFSETFLRTAAGFFGTLFENFFGESVIIDSEQIGALTDNVFNGLSGAVDGALEQFTGFLSGIGERIGLPDGVLDNLFGGLEMPSLPTNLLEGLFSEGMTIDTGVITEAFSGLSEVIDAAISDIVSFSTIGEFSLVDDIVTIVEGVGTALAGLGLIVYSAFLGVKAVVDTWWATFEPFWEEVWGGLKKIVANVMATLGAVFSNSFKTTVGIFKRGIATLVKVFGNIGKQLRLALNIVASLLRGDWSQLWESLGNYLKLGVDNLKLLFTGGLENLRAIAQTVIENLGTLFAGGWENIKIGLATAVAALGALWERFVENVRNIPDRVAEIFAGLVAKLEIVMINIGAAIVGAWNSIKADGEERIAAIVETVTGIWEGLVTILEGVWEAIQTVVTIALGILLAYLTGQTETGNAMVAAIWEKLVGIVENVWAKIGETITRILGGIGTWIEETIENIKTGAKEKWDTMWANVKEAYGNMKASIVETFNSIGPWLEETIENIKANAKEKWDEMLANAKEIYQQLKDDIQAKIQELKDALPGLWEDMKANAKEKWDEATAAVIQAAVDLYDGVVAKIAEIKEWIGNFSLKEEGGNLIQGLIEGITGKLGDAVKAVSGVVQGIIDAATGKLDMHSPSRVFMGIGTQTGEGFIQGLTGTEGSMAAAIAGAMGAATASAADSVKGLVAIIDEAWVRIGQSTVAAWKEIGAVISAAAGGLGSQIPGELNKLQAVVLATWQKMSAVAGTAWGGMVAGVSKILSALTGITSAAFSGIGLLVSSLTLRATTGVMTAWNTAAQRLTTLWNALLATGRLTWETLAQAIATAVNTLMQQLTASWEAIRIDTLTKSEAIKVGTETIWTALVSSVATAVSGLQTSLAALWMAIKDAAIQSWVALRVGVLEEVKTLVKALYEVFDDVLEYMVEFAEKDMFDIGNLMILGLVRGIEAYTWALLDAIWRVLGEAKAWAWRILNLDSPSKVYQEMGELTMEGFALGIEGMSGRVSGAIDDVIGGALAGGAFKELDKMKRQMRTAMESVVSGNTLSMQAMPAMAYGAGSVDNSRSVSIEINPTYTRQQSEASIYYDVSAALAAARL